MIGWYFPADFTELDMLEMEADFYQLTELTDAVKVLQNGEQYAKRNKEYLEIMIKDSHRSLRIYANANVLSEFPELARIFSKQQQQTGQQTWKEKIDMAPYYPFRLSLVNFSYDQYYNHKDFTLNRIQLLTEVTQLGFVLVGSSKPDNFESWTFNRTMPST